MHLGFRRFRTRILFFFITLLGIVLIFAFIAVDIVSVRSAHSQITRSLEIGSRVFGLLTKNRVQQLTEATRILSMDFAFKKTFVVADHDTTLSALVNLENRIKADTVMLVSLEYNIIADTLRPELAGKSFSHYKFIEACEEEGEVSCILPINGNYYQMVVVPLLAPDPVAWFCIGFLIDDLLVKKFQSLVLSDVSLLLVNSENKWSSIASTLPQNLLNSLLGTVLTADWDTRKSISFKMNGGEYVTLITALQEDDNYSIYAVLQRSMQEVLLPYQRLRKTLILFFSGVIAISIAAAFMISRTVTRPVQILVKGVREINKGNYDSRVSISQQDEMGELASAYNNMVKGLEERERVKNLLGKVVSTDIAHELLNKKVELGGEEREVTIMFSDIRNFTAISERRTPQEVLTLLNRYLNKMSSIIESYGGVIDKYMGDAIMALFGAPLQRSNDTDRAFNTAIDMCVAMDELNMDLEKEGLTQLNIGIGINTAVVVAGNMGSQNRLNYTVIGDGVNTASRLEGLTKEKKYDTRIIVSESSLQKAKGHFKTRSLGRVLVKGKDEMLAIYALSGSDDC
ncbi:MAG: HAMP domain-containing protein [Planctomycetes bacterium]|nr:HAMP domain-containing protein [Planctomycetota bacterium]